MEDTETPNPAITKRTQIPPALIEAVMGDAAAAQPAIRAQALVQLHELHTMRNTFTASQRMQLAELTSKLGDMVPKAQTQSGGSGAVTINFIRSSSEKSVTIEATAVTVDE